MVGLPTESLSPFAPSLLLLFVSFALPSFSHWFLLFSSRSFQAKKKKKPQFSSLSGGATNIWRIHVLFGQIFPESFLLGGLRILLSSVSWRCLSSLDP